MNVYNIGDYCYYKEPIGHGSFSIIYKGYCYNTKKTVAVKKIIKLVETKYFDREVSLMRKLDHPNILKLYDVIKKKDGVYLILEFCNGGDLAKYIHKKNYKWDIQYFKEISYGLKYLHQNNVLHRDIKPQNILIHNHNIKISDFGFAKSFEKHELITTFCGSPLYMAPEIIKDHEYDTKSDIWSLGVIFYELITKRHPYYIKTRKELNQMVYKGYNINFHIIKNTKCRELIKNMLEPNPQKRYDWNTIFNEIEGIIDNINELNINTKSNVSNLVIEEKILNQNELNILKSDNKIEITDTGYTPTNIDLNNFEKDNSIDKIDSYLDDKSELNLYDFNSFDSSDILISENDQVKYTSKPIMIPNKYIGKKNIIPENILSYNDNSGVSVFSNPEKIDRTDTYVNKDVNKDVKIIEYDDYKIVSRSAPTINLMGSFVCDYMQTKINENDNINENFHIIGTSPVLQPMGFTNYLDKSVKTISGLLNFKL